MTGRLRALSSHRIADRDRQRLFVALAAAVVVAAAVALLATRPVTHQTASRARPLSGGPAHTTHAPGNQPAPVARPTVSVGEISAARAFLDGYLRLVYGNPSRGRLPDATATLQRQLISRRVLVSPAQRRRHPRVVSLTAVRSQAGWRVRAVIADGGVAEYPIALTLVRGGRGWLVSGVSD